MFFEALQIAGFEATDIRRIAGNHDLALPLYRAYRAALEEEEYRLRHRTFHIAIATETTLSQLMDKAGCGFDDDEVGQALLAISGCAKESTRLMLQGMTMRIAYVDAPQSILQTQAGLEADRICGVGIMLLMAFAATYPEEITAEPLVGLGTCVNGTVMHCPAVYRKDGKMRVGLVACTETPLPKEYRYLVAPC